MTITAARINGANIVTYPTLTAEIGLVAAANTTYPYGDVRRFGADPTGVDDSTTAIMNAHNVAVAVGGGIVYFPEGSYKYTTLNPKSASPFNPVIWRGAGQYSTVLYCYGTGQGVTSLQCGNAGLDDNCGWVSLQNLTVDGSHVTGSGTALEVNGVGVSSASRYTAWGDVVIRNFTKGLGLKVENTYIVNWGAVYVVNCYKAFASSIFNAAKFGPLHVELCGPFHDATTGLSTYTHSTIPHTDPSVDLSGAELFVPECMIESNTSLTNLKVSGQVTIGAYYAESNIGVSATGNEVLMAGDSPHIMNALIQNGLYGAPPNPRYLISLGSSVNAKIDHFTYQSPGAPDQTNTLFGVDFATSDRGNVTIYFEGFENGITQRAAYQQTVRLNKNRCTLNGVKYVGGMPARTVANLLLNKYNQIPLSESLMDRGAAGYAVGFTALNVSGAAYINNTDMFCGGVVQHIARSAASETGLYRTFVAGTLSQTNSYFVSSFIHGDWSKATLCLKMVETGVGTSSIRPASPPGQAAWGRCSDIRIFSNATAGDVTIYAVDVNDTGTYLVANCVVLDLTQFDTDYGTSLATYPVLDIEDIVNLDTFPQRNLWCWQMPGIGAYEIGDFVRNSNPVVAGSAGSHYVVSGWIRLTTGSGHIAGTDWAEARTLTGT